MMLYCVTMVKNETVWEGAQCNAGLEKKYLSISFRNKFSGVVHISHVRGNTQDFSGSTCKMIQDFGVLRDFPAPTYGDTMFLFFCLSQDLPIPIGSVTPTVGPVENVSSVCL